LDAKTKSDAVRAYQGLRTDRDRGDIHENRLLNPTVDEVCDELLERMQMRVDAQDERLRVAPKTIVNYRKQMKHHLRPVLGRKRIADVDIVDIRRLADTVGAKKLAPSSVKSVISVTTVMFSFAVKQGYTDRNVVRDLDRDERSG